VVLFRIEGKEGNPNSIGNSTNERTSRGRGSTVQAEHDQIVQRYADDECFNSGLSRPSDFYISHVETRGSHVRVVKRNRYRWLRFQHEICTRQEPFSNVRASSETRNYCCYTHAHTHVWNLRKNRISSRLIVGFARLLRGLKLFARRWIRSRCRIFHARVPLPMAAFPQDVYRTSSKNVLIEILLDGNYELLFSRRRKLR